MSFLDNLENNLKSLESSEQGKDDAERQRRARDRERERVRAAAPFAEELKNSPFTAELLKRAGDRPGAARAYEKAIELSANAVERAELERRLEDL